MNWDEYCEILENLHGSMYDSNKTGNEQYAEQLQSVKAEFVKRNAKLTDLLAGYIKQQEKRVRENGFLKKFLF